MDIFVFPITNIIDPRVSKITTLLTTIRESQFGIFGRSAPPINKVFFGGKEKEIWKRMSWPRPFRCLLATPTPTQIHYKFSVGQGVNLLLISRCYAHGDNFFCPYRTHDKYAYYRSLYPPVNLLGRGYYNISAHLLPCHATCRYIPWFTWFGTVSLAKCFEPQPTWEYLKLEESVVKIYSEWAFCGDSFKHSE